MRKERYLVISKFSCCGKDMVTVIMNGAACVMPKHEFSKIMENERKFSRDSVMREAVCK